ncbi:monovalent cation/H(+) antiporter subunit G [Pontibacter diazotrophicus]|uniref:Monovalent cation/H(+) antiporter subunit G n=1 Tax=Pontibacter diazotrophicus TaxID=1400979 RepID=A0A3D8LBJ7_9BACT|nr:monovalent cation/H(+) antiporter subunit G [Pontibacter diazotrophicus]RDV14778.1 monovalent cation/H(+) antiporter subunit G [Pontibacter diazotrophicus]
MNIDLHFVKEIISSVLILMGVFFMLVAAIGLLRLPDFYTRMSAITKGATLGMGLIVLGIGVYFNDPEMMFKILAILFFTIITSPVAAHAITRTAIHKKVTFWKKTNLEEFEEYLRENRLKEYAGQKKYPKEPHNSIKRADDTE